MEWQKEDIEYAISSYVERMNQELYVLLSQGKEGYLQQPETFAFDLADAVDKLDKMKNDK